MTLAIATSSALWAQENLFSGDLSTWVLKNSPIVSTAANVVTEDGAEALCVEVSGLQESPGTTADVRISQVFGDINAGQTYQINFQVKSEQPGKIVIFISPDHDSQKVIFRKDLAVDPEWTDYKITFPSKETTSQCVLGFAGLGRSDNKFFFRPLVEAN